MGEDHGAYETDASGDPRGEQRGDSCKDIGPKENRAEREGLNSKSQIKPVGSKTLDNKAPRERIESKEARKFEDHVTRVCESQESSEQRRMWCCRCRDFRRRR